MNKMELFQRSVARLGRAIHATTPEQLAEIKAEMRADACSCENGYITVANGPDDYDLELCSCMEREKETGSSCCSASVTDDSRCEDCKEGCSEVELE